MLKTYQENCVTMEQHPFPDLKIDSADFFDDLEGRQKCPKCEKSRKFYCYSCYVPLEGTEDKIPKVELPISIDIIKHPQEVDGKSTSGHAALVAPDRVRVYTYPVIPDYPDKSKVLLVFPGENSLTLDDFAKKCCPLRATGISDGDADVVSANFSSADRETKSDRSGSSLMTGDKAVCDEDSCSAVKDCGSESSRCDSSAGVCGALSKRDASEAQQCSCKRLKSCPSEAKYHKVFDKVVFIDSTWHQVRRIYLDDRLAGLQKIELKTQTTKFWRHQKDKPETFLSTIEAIYYFLRELHDLFEQSPYDGQYDNLLFFFVFMYKKIRCKYDNGRVLKAYEERQK